MNDLIAQRIGGVASCSYRIPSASRPRLQKLSLPGSQNRTPKDEGTSGPEASTASSLLQWNRRKLGRCQDDLSSGLPVKLWRPNLIKGVSASQLFGTLLPSPSSAAETLPVEFIASFLDQVENLGPYGPLFFVATVISAEMLPLFPTQPLSIASGLLFGAPKGAAYAFLATSTAAILAFQVSRNLGRKLVEQAGAKEFEEAESKGFLSSVERAIDSGNFQQQLVAVTLLRLTPVVPFSASNYLLGATPLNFSAYVVGSVIGLSFWCTLFAVVGNAGRDLFKNGASIEVLLEDLQGRAGNLTQTAGIGMAALGLIALGYFGYVQVSGQGAENNNEDSDSKPKDKYRQAR